MTDTVTKPDPINDSFDAIFLRIEKQNELWDISMDRFIAAYEKCFNEKYQKKVVTDKVLTSTTS